MIQHSIHLENGLVATMTYICPICGKNFSLKRPVLYEIGDADTQQKRDIFSFKIFDHTCEHCGRHINALNNFTLIRNSREENANYILHFMSDRDVKKAMEKFTDHLTHLYYDNDMLIEIDDLGNFINAGYPCRIVRSKFEFGEKNFIFGDGLDDRVIEVQKLMVKNRFLKEHPNMKDPILFYNNLTNGKFIWRVLVGREYTNYASPEDEYKVAENVVRYSIKYWNSNLMFIVDEFLAQTMVEIYNGHKNTVPAGYANIRLKSEAVREAEGKRIETERNNQRRYQPARPGYQPQRTTGYRPASTYETGSNRGSSYDGGSSSYTAPTYPNPGFEFKYDQVRAMNEGGSSGYESYVTPTNTYYGNSEYRPFMSDGSTVEQYHMDEGASPMGE